MGRLLHFLTHGAPLARFARESSAIIILTRNTSVAEPLVEFDGGWAKKCKGQGRGHEVNYSGEKRGSRCWRLAVKLEGESRFELIYQPYVRESGKLIRIFSFVESGNLGFGTGIQEYRNPGLESGIQLKEFRNPTDYWNRSEIQVQLVKNLKSRPGIRNPRCGIQNYMGQYLS